MQNELNYYQILDPGHSKFKIDVSTDDGRDLSLIILMFSGKRAHRNPRNLFVLNLVISGLLTSILCLPPTLLQCLYTGQWILGVAACKIVPATQGQSSVTS